MFFWFTLFFYCLIHNSLFQRSDNFKEVSCLSYGIVVLEVMVSWFWKTFANVPLAITKSTVPKYLQCQSQGKVQSCSSPPIWSSETLVRHVCYEMGRASCLLLLWFCSGVIQIHLFLRASRTFSFAITVTYNPRLMVIFMVVRWHTYNCFSSLAWSWVSSQERVTLYIQINHWTMVLESTSALQMY